MRTHTTTTHDFFATMRTMSLLTTSRRSRRSLPNHSFRNVCQSSSFPEFPDRKLSSHISAAVMKSIDIICCVCWLSSGLPLGPPSPPPFPSPLSPPPPPLPPAPLFKSLLLPSLDCFISDSSSKKRPNPGTQAGETESCLQHDPHPPNTHTRIIPYLLAPWHTTYSCLGEWSRAEWSS